MIKRISYTGFAVAIAWPETYCKESGAWYDHLLLRLGINKNNYYKVGHAAVVLIDAEDGKAHYFDFGRYHAPYKYGRVRNVLTDHDLKIHTRPQISTDWKRLENCLEILTELQNNPSCHGEGKLHASWCRIDFKKAFNKAMEMQDRIAIPYGPFRYKGSNCSRFVNTTILAGNPSFIQQVKLRYFVPLTPTPMNNVNSLGKKVILKKLLQTKAFFPEQRLERSILYSTLPQPGKHPNVPQNAQWLSGEGCGSWFRLEKEGTLIRVTRYSPQGIEECTGLFKNRGSLNLPSNVDEYSITYPSNCRMVTLQYADRKINLVPAILPKQNSLRQRIIYHSTGETGARV